MRYERVDLVDEYVEGDEMVVMLNDGRVLALSPVATVVMSTLRDGSQSDTDLGALLVEKFGQPPSVEADPLPIRSVLTVMSDTGLLRDLSL